MLDTTRISGAFTFETLRTMWDYATADGPDEVSQPGYFSGMGNLMKRGDFIFCTMTMLTDPEYRVGVIVSGDDLGNIQIGWLIALKTSDVVT